MKSSKQQNIKFGRNYEMKSSSEEPSQENQVTTNQVEDRFDLSALPKETTSQKVIRRIDLPVQFTRIAVLAFIIWIWQSR